MYFDIEEATKLLAEAVQLASSLFGHGQAHLTKLAGRLPIEPSQQQGFLAQGLNQLAKGLIAGCIERDPNEAKRQLQSGAHLPFLTTDDIADFRRQIQDRPSQHQPPADHVTASGTSFTPPLRKANFSAGDRISTDRDDHGNVDPFASPSAGLAISPAAGQFVQLGERSASTDTFSDGKDVDLVQVRRQKLKALVDDVNKRRIERAEANTRADAIFPNNPARAEYPHRA